MDHSEWMQKHFRDLCHSFGFRFTPREEIEHRLSRTRAFMDRIGMDALLVVQKMDFFYLSGTAQDGLLFVPLEGDPFLLIKREFERARIESPLNDVAPLKSNRDLPTLIQNRLGKLPGRMGLELDVLPVRDYWRYQELFQGIEFEDAYSRSGSGPVSQPRELSGCNQSGADLHLRRLEFP